MDYKMSEVNTNRTVAIVFNRKSNTFMAKCSYEDEYVGVIYGEDFNFNEMIKEYNPTEVDIFANIDFADCTNGDVMPISDICDKCYNRDIIFTVYDMYDEDCTTYFYY